MQNFGLSHENQQGAEVFVVNGDAQYSKAPAQWARNGHLQFDSLRMPSSY